MVRIGEQHAVRPDRHAVSEPYLAPRGVHVDADGEMRVSPQDEGPGVAQNVTALVQHRILRQEDVTAVADARA